MSKHRRAKPESRPKTVSSSIILSTCDSSVITLTSKYPVHASTWSLVLLLLIANKTFLA